MFPPGLIVHLTPPSSPPRVTTRATTMRATTGPPPAAWSAFEAAWVGRDDLVDGPSGLTPRFLLPHAVSDHFPWHIIEALDGAIANHQGLVQAPWEGRGS
jgi:hypothetical protein